MLGRTNVSLPVCNSSSAPPCRSAGGEPAPPPKAPAAAFDYGTSDGYRFFLDAGPVANINEKYFNYSVPTWNEYMDHPNYDEYWQRRNLLPHLGVARAEREQMRRFQEAFSLSAYDAEGLTRERSVADWFEVALIPNQFVSRYRP